MRLSDNIAKALYMQWLSVPGDIDQDLWILHEYAKRCHHITEFGTRMGVSTSALLAARPTTLITYDIEAFPPKRVFDAYAKALQIDFRFVRANTLEVEIEPTEMLFIDTLHTYTQLKAELDRHATKVSHYLAFHDTVSFGTVGEDKTTPGLNQALRDFVGRDEWKTELVSHAQNGLTVLRRIKDAADRT